MNKRINLDEIEWIPSSVVDPVGRVFQWNGRLFRAIRDDFVSFYNQLFSNSVFDKLYTSGIFMKNSIAPYSLKGYGLVIEHEKITYPSYPFEWCGEMYRDAALLVCDLSLELASFGMTLKDIHPYNIMFDSYQPKYVDIGSIIPASDKNKWALADDFYLGLVYPLYSMVTGKSDKVRRFLRYELNDQFLRKELVNLISWHKRISLNLSRIKYKIGLKTDVINAIKREIQNINLTSAKTEWSQYSAKDREDYFLPFKPSATWHDKQKNVYAIIKKLKPKTVVDIGCNIGWYAELAAREGAKVVAFDVDEVSITEIYKRAKAKKLPIQTAMVDFRKATASNITWPAAPERFNSDLVLALAVTHHLVFKNYLHLDTISKELSQYSRKWLLVEFIPPDDLYIKHWVRKEHDWYSLENFIIALKRFFPKIEILSSSPYPRKLVFCEK